MGFRVSGVRVCLGLRVTQVTTARAEVEVTESLEILPKLKKTDIHPEPFGFRASGSGTIFRVLVPQ